MTPQQIDLVQSSFAKVAPNADAVAALFYNRLFEIAPELRPLFKGDMASQGAKLMAALAVAVNSLKKPEAIIPALRAMGARHREYGVKDEHYATVAAALVWTLEQGLGADFTEEMRGAWVDTYTLVATTMMDAPSARAA